jgi:hypothetical protein
MEYKREAVILYVQLDPAKILKLTRSQFASTSNFNSPLHLKFIPFKIVSSGLNIMIPFSGPVEVN